MYLEERADLSELGLGSKEAKGQDGANVLRYGVEMGDEAIGHLSGRRLRKRTGSGRVSATRSRGASKGWLHRG